MPAGAGGALMHEDPAASPAVVRSRGAAAAGRLAGDGEGERAGAESGFGPEQWRDRRRRRNRKRRRNRNKLKVGASGGSCRRGGSPSALTAAGLERGVLFNNNGSLSNTGQRVHWQQCSSLRSVDV